MATNRCMPPRSDTSIALSIPYPHHPHISSPFATFVDLTPTKHPFNIRSSTDLVRPFQPVSEQSCVIYYIYYTGLHPIPTLICTLCDDTLRFCA
jgi:hypothetical protein